MLTSSGVPANLLWNGVPGVGLLPECFWETVAAIATRLTLTFKRTGSLPKATPLVVNLEK